jgi:hypothetical protein
MPILSGTVRTVGSAVGTVRSTVGSVVGSAVQAVGTAGRYVGHHLRDVNGNYAGGNYVQSSFGVERNNAKSEELTILLMKFLKLCNANYLLKISSAYSAEFQLGSNVVKSIHPYSKNFPATNILDTSTFAPFKYNLLGLFSPHQEGYIDVIAEMKKHGESNFQYPKYKLTETGKTFTKALTEECSTNPVTNKIIRDILLFLRYDWGDSIIPKSGSITVDLIALTKLEEAYIDIYRHINHKIYIETKNETVYNHNPVHKVTSSADKRVTCYLRGDDHLKYFLRRRTIIDIGYYSHKQVTEAITWFIKEYYPNLSDDDKLRHSKPREYKDLENEWYEEYKNRKYSIAPAIDAFKFITDELEQDIYDYNHAISLIWDDYKAFEKHVLLLYRNHKYPNRLDEVFKGEKDLGTFLNMLKREDRIAQIRDIKRHTSDKDTGIISVILVLERDEFAILSSLCTQNNRLLGLKGPNNSGYERIYETINSTLDLPEYDIVEISQYDEMYFQLMIEMKKKQAAPARKAEQNELFKRYGNPNEFHLREQQEAEPAAEQQAAPARKAEQNELFKRYGNPNEFHLREQQEAEPAAEPEAAAATETADIHLELEETREESDQPTGGRKRKSTKRRKSINKRRKSINKRRKSTNKRRKSMRRR